MPFTRILKSARTLHAPNAYEIRMASHLHQGKDKPRGIYFSISEEVIRDLGWDTMPSVVSPERKTCKIEIQEGVGKDAGFLLFTAPMDKLSTPYLFGTAKGSSRAFITQVSITRIKHYVLNEVPALSTVVEFTIDEKERTILVQCPDWLRYNPLSYQEPEPEPKQEQAVKLAHAVSDNMKEMLKDAAKRIPVNRQERRAVVAAAARAIKR